MSMKSNSRIACLVKAIMTVYICMSISFTGGWIFTKQLIVLNNQHKNKWYHTTSTATSNMSKITSILLL